MKHIEKIRLSAFLDGEVSEEERAEISEHLKVCSYCRREAEELSRVTALFGSVEDVEVPPYFLTRLRRLVAEPKSKTVIRLQFIEWVRKFLLAGIAVPLGTTALLFLSLMFGSHLGTVIYQEREEQALISDVEFAKVFGITSLDDFPDGSLGDAYISILTQGGE